MLLIIFAVFILIAILLFIQKLVYKGRLERGLGRKVTDRELTSISSWMDASPSGGEGVKRKDESAAGK